MLALADEADDVGVGAANRQRLAEKCGMTDDMFRQTIGLLESAGRIALVGTEDHVPRAVKHCILALNQRRPALLRH